MVFSLVRSLLILSIALLLAVAGGSPFANASDSVNRVDRVVFSSLFSQFGMFTQESVDGAALPLLNVDQGFFARDLSRAVFVKYDVDLKHEFFSGARAKVDDATVIHGKTLSGHSFAMLFYGFSDSEFASVEKSVREAAGDMKRESALLRLMIPRACAAEADCSGRDSVIAGLTKALGGVVRNDVVESIVSCGLSGVSGAVTSLGDDLKAAGKFLTNPIGAFRETVAQFKAIKEAVVVLGSHFDDFVKAAPRIPPELLRTIACSLGGQLLPKLAMLAVGGAGAAKLAMMAARLIPTFKKLIELFESISKLGKVPNIKEAVEGILNCAG